MIHEIETLCPCCRHRTRCLMTIDRHQEKEVRHCTVCSVTWHITMGLIADPNNFATMTIVGPEDEIEEAET